MRIGLFGGTFNPVHFGHLNLAIELSERHALDEVWWIPTHTSPFRQGEESVEPHKRLEMVKRALVALPHFKALPIEIERPPPSYTIDTIETLVQGDAHFFLLLADETYAAFDQWKESKKIRERVDILVGSRTSSGGEMPVMEISSTRVRERLKKGLYCGHLVPPNVLDYIHENQLYFTPK